MTVDSISRVAQTSTAKTAVTKQAGRKDGDFSSYLEQETTSLDDIFAKAAKTYDLSVNLLKAVAKAESAFQNDVVSGSGAQGLMQLMPATAEYLGVKDPFDPEQNIMGGAKYLASLMDRFDGNVKLALAGYNAGPGNVSKYGGIPPFEETQNYVVKVMKYMGESIDLSDKTVQKKTSSANQNSSYTAPLLQVPQEKEEIKIDDALSRWNDLLSYEEYDWMMKLLYGEEDQQKQKQDGEKDSSALFSQLSFSSHFANLFKTQNL